MILRGANPILPRGLSVHTSKLTDWSCLLLRRFWILRRSFRKDLGRVWQRLLQTLINRSLKLVEGDTFLLIKTLSKLSLTVLSLSITFKYFAITSDHTSEPFYDPYRSTYSNQLSPELPVFVSFHPSHFLMMERISNRKSSFSLLINFVSFLKAQS